MEQIEFFFKEICQRGIPATTALRMRRTEMVCARGGRNLESAPAPSDDGPRGGNPGRQPPAPLLGKNGAGGLGRGIPQTPRRRRPF